MLSNVHVGRNLVKNEQEMKLLKPGRGGEGRLLLDKE